MGSAQPRRDIERIVAWHRDGALKLDELVSGLYPLDEINEAIAVVRRGEAIRNVNTMATSRPNPEGHTNHGAAMSNPSSCNSSVRAR